MNTFLTALITSLLFTGSTGFLLFSADSASACDAAGYYDDCDNDDKEEEEVLVIGERDDDDDDDDDDFDFDERDEDDHKDEDEDEDEDGDDKDGKKDDEKEVTECEIVEVEYSICKATSQTHRDTRIATCGWLALFPGDLYDHCEKRADTKLSRDLANCDLTYTSDKVRCD